jgi:hypothetical protein
VVYFHAHPILETTSVEYELCAVSVKVSVQLLQDRRNTAGC